MSRDLRVWAHKKEQSCCFYFQFISLKEPIGVEMFVKTGYNDWKGILKKGKKEKENEETKKHLCFFQLLPRFASCFVVGLLARRHLFR